MRKAVRIALILLFFNHLSPAQTFGVYVGLENQLLGIEPLDQRPDELPYVEAGRPEFGGSVGAFVRWRIAPGLYLQPELGVAFLHNTVTFRPESDTESRRRYRFTDVELPLHLVFIQPKNVFPLRATMLFGARLGWNAAANDNTALGILRERAAVDAGLGAAISLGKWQLQPEVLYSHGLNNMHDVQNRAYDKYTGRMVRDRLTVRVLISRH